MHVDIFAHFFVLFFSAIFSLFNRFLHDLQAFLKLLNIQKVDYFQIYAEIDEVVSFHREMIFAYGRKLANIIQDMWWMVRAIQLLDFEINYLEMSRPGYFRLFLVPFSKVSSSYSQYFRATL